MESKRKKPGHMKPRIPKSTKGKFHWSRQRSCGTIIYSLFIKSESGHVYSNQRAFFNPSLASSCRSMIANEIRLCRKDLISAIRVVNSIKHY